MGCWRYSRRAVSRVSCRTAPSRKWASYFATRSSEYSYVWMEAIKFLMDSWWPGQPRKCLKYTRGATFNIVNAKWLYKRHGDSSGIVQRAKARMVAVGYSQQRRQDTSRLSTQRHLLHLTGWYCSCPGVRAGLEPETRRLRVVSRSMI